MKRIGLAVPLLIAIAIAPLLALAMYRGGENVVEVGIALGIQKPGHASLVMEASYTVTLVRNGTEIMRIKKDGDPITTHFYRLVANTLLGFYRKNIISWTDITGTARSTAIDTEFAGRNPLMYIAIGTGTGTLSPNRNAMFNMLTMNPVNTSSHISHTDTGTSRIITYVRPFTFTASYTITEVALILEVDVDLSSSSGVSIARVLVAHDLLPQPVSVVSGDVLTVTYAITIPYTESGPLTRNFINALINYMLGFTRATGTRLPMTHQGGSNGIVDTACDRTDLGYYQDYIAGEYIHIEIGTGTPSTLPYYINNLVNRIIRIRNTDAAFSMTFTDEAQRAVVTFTVGVPFTSSASVREIAFTYNTDVVEDSSAGENYYVWLYWFLSTPINVNAGDSLRVRVVIELPFGV